MDGRGEARDFYLRKEENSDAWKIHTNTQEGWLTSSVLMQSVIYVSQMFVCTFATKINMDFLKSKLTYFALFKCLDSPYSSQYSYIRT